MTVARDSFYVGLPDRMYVTTFYSFKGGVGRSMALANVAVELAKRGRRVLTVDFDLEAPGLDTFDVLRPQRPVPGIIDFVRDYLDLNRAPDASGFMSRLSDVGDRGGELWIMPSGAQQATYAAHFNQIDWAELYEKRDGYLLFEDLKAQWKQVINPDYVLIDSRTGHTDTGGICTRQLPDAVAILFFPNEQNLRGLTKVVQDIRAEDAEQRKKKIELHFVMSNVPDLDDEDRILDHKIDMFRKQLDFGRELTIVHRYDSLSLLNQVVFTKDRPRSRLANEYRAVVREIVRCNLADRDGALDYIKQARSRWRHHRMAPESTEKKLETIENAHSDDGEILFALGAFWENDQQLDRAALLLNRAIDAGYDEPRAYLKRARVRADDDPAGATEDALQVLQADGLPPPLVREAVRLVSADRAGDVAESTAVMALEVTDRVWLANRLEDSSKEIGIAVSILTPLVSDEDLPIETLANARSILALRYLGIGKCAAAAALLRHGECDVSGMSIQDAFNYGMATWGETGEVVAAPFARAVELNQSNPEREDPNYLQCMAVACWAADDTEKGIEFVRQARAVVGVKRGSFVSCWRYLHVSGKEFLDDLNEIEALISGDASRTPRFMTEGAAPRRLKQTKNERMADE